MSTDYNYDEAGQFFPYFILTLTALFTVPITYFALRPSKELANTAPRIQSSYRPQSADLVDKQRWKQKRRERKLKRMITAALGWVVILWMLYLMVVTARLVPKIWDPYEVLGLSRSANEKQIKSHYRKLSITQHPDKKRPDPAKNETVQSINDHWVDITKAFKTLTDEEIRNNYIQYGHPDGKQSFSIGIALPQFLVSEGNGKYVLLLYGALLGVLLPYLVGSWWYGTQKRTKEKVLVSSAGRLFKEYEEDLNEGGVIAALSNGEEFEEILNGKAEADLHTVEQKVLAASSDLKMTDFDRTKLEESTNEEKRKALALLWAYMGRIDLGDASLNEQKFEVAPIAHLLNEAFSTMLPLFGNTKPLLSSYHTSQNLIQALPHGASPLLQLPHFTPKLARSIEVELGRRNMSLQAFMEIPDQKRKSLLLSHGLNSNEYSTVVKVASQIPHVRVEKAFFKVTGEKAITPGSLLLLVVKARIIPPGTMNIPPVKEKDLEDVDPKEGDLDALNGRKKTDDVPTQPTLAHAPYFARDYAPSWYIFLGENKSGKIAVPPFKFTEFNKPIFNEDGSPTFNVQTLRMQFGAPPQANAYPFTMHLLCDSYVGMDSQVDVIMKVEEATAAESVVEEDEISEPEEDSIAGQMNAMRGGETPKKASRKVAEVDDDDDDDSSGSDTEGEADSDSDTDTDTDTDEE